MSDQAHELRELVRRDYALATTDAPGRPRLLAVSGGRDGVGTTTLALGLATAAAKAGRRVLLVDADPKRGDVAAICGLAERYTLADVLSAKRDVREAIQPGPGGIWILPGGWAGNSSEVRQQPAPEVFHSRLIQPLKTLGNRFDLVIIDAGNGANRETDERRRAADVLILVTTPDLPAIMDTYTAIKQSCAKDRQAAVHCLVNMADDAETAADVYKRLEQSCRRFLGIELLGAGHLPRKAATVADNLSALSKTLFSDVPVCSSGFSRNSNKTAILGQKIPA